MRFPATLSLPPFGVDLTSECEMPFDAVNASSHAKINAPTPLRLKT